MSGAPHLQMVKSSDSSIGEPWNLKAADVAEYLGMTREEVYRIPEEHLPYAKLGRRRRYRASAVRAYVEDRVQGAV